MSLCKAKLPGAKEVPLVPEEAATLTKMSDISTCSHFDFSFVPDNQAVGLSMGLQFLFIREERDAHQRVMSGASPSWTCEMLASSELLWEASSATAQIGTTHTYPST